MAAVDAWIWLEALPNHTARTMAFVEWSHYMPLVPAVNLCF